MNKDNVAFKYETRYKGLIEITYFWTNSTVTLQCGANTMMHNIYNIKPYTFDTNAEDIITKN